LFADNDPIGMMSGERDRSMVTPDVITWWVAASFFSPFFLTGIGMAVGELGRAGLLSPL
jgi:hypothetical protein